MKLDCARCNQANGPFDMHGNFDWKCAYCGRQNTHVCTCTTHVKEELPDVEFQMDEDLDKQLNEQGE